MHPTAPQEADYDSSEKVQKLNEALGCERCTALLLASRFKIQVLEIVFVITVGP